MTTTAHEDQFTVGTQTIEVEMSRYTLRWIDGPVPVGTKLYASPVPAPAAPDSNLVESRQIKTHVAPAPEEWRTMLQWLINQRGKAGHCHARPGIWDDDNGMLAGKPCEQCAMYDRARALLQSAEVKK